MDRATPEFARIRVALSESVFFRSLSAVCLDELAGAGHIERWDKGGIVHARGTATDKLRVVLEGGLIVSWVNAHGESIPVASIGTGSFYSSASLVNEARAGTECRAEHHTVLAVFPRRKLLQIAHNHPSFANWLSKLLVQRLDAAVGYYANSVSAPLPERLARRLLGQALTSRRTAPSSEVELSVSQVDLARIVGASRSKVNAQLRVLETEGVLRLAYRKIYLRDIDRLTAIAGGAPPPV